jgi:hypothetical protein
MGLMASPPSGMFSGREASATGAFLDVSHGVSGVLPSSSHMISICSDGFSHRLECLRRNFGVVVFPASGMPMSGQQQLKASFLANRRKLGDRAFCSKCVSSRCSLHFGHISEFVMPWVARSKGSSRPGKPAVLQVLANALRWTEERLYLRVCVSQCFYLLRPLNIQSFGNQC